nr:NAD(P)H-dependent oxidoreductase subunit E [Bacteroidota bacterium]
MEHTIIDITIRIIKNHGSTPESVIPILQDIQQEFNYLPEEALKLVCEQTDISASQIIGVASFYSQFRFRPVGKHIIKVCVGTACHVKGAMLVYDAFKRNLKLEGDEDTDPEGLFTLEKVACLGCCTIAPVVQIDNLTYGHVTTEKVPKVIDDFLNNASGSQKTRLIKNPDLKVSQGEIRIGLGSCCIASGSAGIKEELDKTIQTNKIDVSIKQVGCVGVCNQVPLMEIHKPGEPSAFYAKIQSHQVKQIIRKHFKSAGPFDRIRNNFYSFFENIVLNDNPRTIHGYEENMRDTPITAFLDGQVNIATEFRGEIKPSDLAEYESLGGFVALRKCLFEYSQDQIIKLVADGGLRGRGGGGFLTGKKWELVNNAEGQTKYIICNGDEGDPGAFMDRMLLESYPFRVIEGMLIAARAVGATEGILYIRAEYPLAVTRIAEALEICRAKGLLGEHILGSDFSINLKIFKGAGAFVCGEETALIASVEGNRGMPSIRPPYPSESGLWENPTLINNTETFSMVPWLVRNGADAFSKIGSETSKGTKVFALAGKIKRGGLIEVPMGITIRRIVEDIGGGIANGKQFKAVQIGGPSGGCIPAEMADTTIDFDSLSEVGAMMGSGGLIVLDENDCMVDIARYFLSFTQDQSCGKCTFCRIGIKKMLDILDRICIGKGVNQDLWQLERLAGLIQKGSICGLGKTAPNPVLTTLKYFRHEYEAHLNGKCPAGRCKEMISYEITDDCIGCTKCAQKCPVDAILPVPYEVHKIDQGLCVKCDTCRVVCPANVVKII